MCCEVDGEEKAEKGVEEEVEGEMEAGMEGETGKMEEMEGGIGEEGMVAGQG